MMNNSKKLHITLTQNEVNLIHPKWEANGTSKRCPPTKTTPKLFRKAID